MRTVAVSIALITFATSAAATMCEWEVTVLDGKTREIRTFHPGPSPMELPLPQVKGFKGCTVSPVKEYEVQGVKATRIDFLCFTTTGGALALGSVASSRFGTDVTRFQLLAGPVTVRAGSDGNSEVKTGGYVELSAECK